MLLPSSTWLPQPPLEHVDLDWLTHAGIEVAILRLDRIDPLISGNKWFKLEVFERHHASADALATAELALILFNRARQQQIHSPLNLQQRLSQWKRRQQAPSF